MLLIQPERCFNCLLCGSGRGGGDPAGRMSDVRLKALEDFERLRGAKLCAGARCVVLDSPSRSWRRVGGGVERQEGTEC